MLVCDLVATMVIVYAENLQSVACKLQFFSRYFITKLVQPQLNACEKLMIVVQANFQIFLQIVFMVLVCLYQKVLNDLITEV